MYRRLKDSLLPFIVATWILCIAHGLLIIVSMPLWEGWDEAFHYSFIQQLAEHRSLPVFGKTVVSSEVATSFKYAPLSLATNMTVGSFYTTFEEYWKLTPDQRRAREYKLRSIEPSERKTYAAPPYDFNSYEALHPPLFYFIASGIYAWSSRWDLPTRVFFLRLFCLLLGSLTIVLAFPIVRYVWTDRRHVVVVLFLLAVLPLFYSIIARVSNDSLGVPLFTALVLLVLRYFNGQARTRDALAAGIVLGLGLLTKAYFLTALPALFGIFLYAAIRGRRDRRLIWHFTVIVFTAFVIAGWWYLRNYALYGNLSGMQEVTLTGNLSLIDRLRAVTTVPWLLSVTAMLKEHIWIGNTSSLGLSRTTYRVGYFLIILSVIGFIKQAVTARAAGQRAPSNTPRKRNLLILSIFYGCFLLGVFYHTLVNFILVRVWSGTGGWYLYAVIVPELILLTYGFEGIAGEKAAKVSNGILILYALVVDLLSTFCKVLPAYAGFFIPRFHLHDLAGLYSPASIAVVLGNLSINRPTFITPTAIGLSLAAYGICLTTTLLWVVSKVRNEDVILGSQSKRPFVATSKAVI